MASNTAWGFFLDRDNGIFFEMLTYPLSRSAYMFGKALFTLLVSLVQTIITVTLAAALFHIPLRWERMPLVFLAVLAAYFVKRFGFRGLALGATLAFPLLLLGGRSGAEASSSTLERIDA